MFSPLPPESPTVRAAARSAPLGHHRPLRRGNLAQVVLCFGVARYPWTGCTHDATYLSVAVTNGRAEFQRRGPIWVILAREDLSFGGSGMRTPENTYLLGTR